MIYTPRFKGVSKAVQLRYEHCLVKLEKQNKSRKRKHLTTYNPYAICYESVVRPKRKIVVHRRGRHKKVSRRR